MTENATKSSYIMHEEYQEIFKNLEPGQAYELIFLLFAYTQTGETAEIKDPAIRISFNIIRAKIDKDNIKYFKVIERNKLNGSKGGRPKKPKKPTGFNENPKNPLEPKKADKDIVFTNVNRQYSDYIASINIILNRSFKGCSKSKGQFSARLKDGYTFEELKQVALNASQSETHIKSQFQYLTPEFLTRADKVEMYKHTRSAKPLQPQLDPDDVAKFYGR